MGFKYNFDKAGLNPAFEDTEEEDIIVIRQGPPLQASFQEGEDEVITLTERSPQESIGEVEDSDQATERIHFSEEDGSIILNPEELSKEAEQDFGSGPSN